MKTGRTLQELAAEIERQSAAKRDYLVQTDSGLAMQVADDGTPKLRLATGESLGINNLAHNQLAAGLEIPRTYYQRMRESQPDLLATNVNRWLKADPAQRLLRTLDGNARAWLSSKYRALDYLQFAEAVLPVLADLELDVISCDVTERRLYLKAVDRSIARDIPTGHRMGDGSHAIFDTVVPAISLRDSEVGCGALAVETGVWTKACTNLAIFAQRSMRKYHVGAKMDLGEEIVQMLGDDTRRATDKAIWMQVRDVVRGAFDRARFDSLVDEIVDTTTQKVVGDPVQVVEAVGRDLGLVEGERSSVLRHLIEGGDLTRYGVFNAVTRTAEDIDDYDRAYEVEVAGAKVIEMPRKSWDVLAATDKKAA